MQFYRATTAERLHARELAAAAQHERCLERQYLALQRMRVDLIKSLATPTRQGRPGVR